MDIEETAGAASRLAKIAKSITSPSHTQLSKHKPPGKKFKTKNPAVKSEGTVGSILRAGLEEIEEAKYTSDHKRLVPKAKPKSKATSTAPGKHDRNDKTVTINKINRANNPAKQKAITAMNRRKRLLNLD